MRARGLTLVEVLVATTLCAAVLLIVGAELLVARDHASQALASQAATAQARRAAALVARELRQANLTAADLEPDVPFDAQAIDFRTVRALAGGVVLSPTRASGAFDRFALQGDELVRVAGGVTAVVAKHVTDFRVTLVPPDRLRVRVATTAGGASAAAEVTVRVWNKEP